MNLKRIEFNSIWFTFVLWSQGYVELKSCIFHYFSLVGIAEKRPGIKIKWNLRKNEGLESLYLDVKVFEIASRCQGI